MDMAIKKMRKDYADMETFYELKQDTRYPALVEVYTEKGFIGFTTLREIADLVKG